MVTCLACGCNGRHLKADGSCLCGCPSLVTKWETPKPASAPLLFDDSDEKAKP